VLLLLAGPFIDKLVSKAWVLDYNFTVPGAQCLAMSCGVAILVNISQFMCLGRFSAISFQVSGCGWLEKAGRVWFHASDEILCNVSGVSFQVSGSTKQAVRGSMPAMGMIRDGGSYCECCCHWLLM